MIGPDAGSRLVRVFEIAQHGPGDDIESVLVELPTQWARHHSAVRIRLEDTEAFGVHATLVGTAGEELLSFGWYDHAERLLLDPDAGPFPVALGRDARWEDLEQGWWAVVVDLAGMVYVAETDFDALLDAPMPPTEVTCRRAGEVFVSGVRVTWSSVPRSAYDAAWQETIAALRTRG